MGIATRVNGTAPPDVPLADIDLGSREFWELDDDVRDGAFATLRREAPISFWGEPDSYPNITTNDQPPEVAECSAR